MEIINEATEKFKDKQDEICDFLFGFLRKLNALEKEVFERGQELERKRKSLESRKVRLLREKQNFLMSLRNVWTSLPRTTSPTSYSSAVTATRSATRRNTVISTANAG